MKTEKNISRIAVCRWKIAGALGLVSTPFLAAEPHDLHHHLIEANKAQIVMLAETGLSPRDEAARIAAALQTAANEQNAAGATRSADYLVLETRLSELIGPEASNLHLGRSRNDLGAAMNRMRMREEILSLVDKLGAARKALLTLAGENVDTVSPGFTHAVQAQPTTLAHYLLALDSSLGRDTERLREAYARVNKSPLGSAAFTTSGFPLDRPRLAALLGFDGLVENSYDAIIVSVADSKLEVASALSISALNIGRFAQDLIFQYADPAPGLVLSDSATGRSSIMPQKRNPSIIERFRFQASLVVGEANTMELFAHNTPLYEVKDVRADLLDRLLIATAAASRLYETFETILSSLVVRPEILRARVDADYSTMTELADTLRREAGVPFRTGYKVASELTTYGRSNGKAPHELTWDEVNTIYRRVAGGDLPLDERQLRRTFDAAELVRNRRGIGGPQPAEVRRMLASHRSDVAGAKGWVDEENSRLQKASDQLQREFAALVEKPER